MSVCFVSEDGARPPPLPLPTILRRVKRKDEADFRRKAKTFSFKDQNDPSEVPLRTTFSPSDNLVAEKIRLAVFEKPVGGKEDVRVEWGWGEG